MACRRVLVLLALAGVAAAPTVQAALKYRVQDLGVVPSGGSTLLVEGMNNLGTVVGVTELDGRLRGFVSRAGQLSLMTPDLRGASTEALPINDLGDAVGAYVRGGGAHTVARPVLLRDGRLVDLSVGGVQATSGIAWDINRAGQVVGTHDGQAFIFDGGVSRYIRLPGAEFSEANTVNDLGVVAGRAFARGGGYDFLWDGTTVTRLPVLSDFRGAFRPQEINNAGQLLGDAPLFASGSLIQSYIYADGHYRSLGNLQAGWNSLAWGLNDRGWAVGVARNLVTDEADRPFLWRNGRMLDLNTLVNPTAGDSPWLLSSARDINDHGQIVGEGFLEDVGWRAYIATPVVPEPGAWALVLAGLVLVGVVAQRRGPP